MTGRLEFLGNEPVPEFRVIGVDIVSGIDQTPLWISRSETGFAHHW